MFCLQKKICRLCKEIHFHKTEIINDKDLIKKAKICVQNYENNMKSSGKNEIIKYYFSKIYIDIKKESYFLDIYMKYCACYLK